MIMRTKTRIFCLLLVVFCLSCTYAQIGKCTIFACSDVENSTSGGENCRKLPCLMYHSVLKSKQGAYIVSPAQIESDLRTLSELGYTTVTVDELVAYADGEGDLPEKPILITFDDGHYNNLYYAEKLFAKYDMHAVVNLVGRFSEYTTASGDRDNPNYSHITWDEVTEMCSRGVFEAGNHTYNMHNYRPRFGVGQRSGETDYDYTAAVVADVGKLQRKLFELTGKECRVFAYPFGKYGKLSESILCGMSFRITLTCNEGVSTVYKGRPETLHLLKRVNRSGNYDVATVMRKIGAF